MPGAGATRWAPTSVTTALAETLGLDPSRSIEDLQRAVLGSSLLDLDDALSPGGLAKVG